MRCIFCKQLSDASLSVEHILPESLGNHLHTLPRGVVCDGCNNYFALKIEKPVLDSGHFFSLRFEQAIPNKKGNVPIQKAILYPNVVVEMVRKADGSTLVRVPSKDWHAVSGDGTGRLVFPKGGPHPEERLMSRFLAKIALESMAHRLIEADHPINPLIDDVQLDPIRDWARRGSTGASWRFHRRVIYAANHRHTDESGETFQCLNEFDFLVTTKEEIYFCLAIFGTEYTMNVGGPEIDGYLEWLIQHKNASPLYWPKRA
jgi:hypothetical protein